ncbi:MAG TPA: lytic transglycosylase domain-containing protein [Candidatus Angelobacter sp.]|nr:lytic transglycosylase domain-containing protein [Candidatus Angelobacter sp.]
MIALSVLSAAGASPRRRGRRRGGNAPARWRQRAQWLWRHLNAAPRPLRIAVIGTTVLALLAATNLVYQVARKPTEMFFPVAGALDKMPVATWAEYGPLFREYSTAAIPPELLAALAQVEGAGNPLARTYWRWRLTWNPLAIYRPASSAVGMYQMTDAAFAAAREACIRDHAVVEDCWFTGLYSRVLPSHAIELAAVSLDRQVAAILAQRPRHARATAQQRQDLAALVHLCGAGPAKAFARRGFRLLPGQRCGDHDAARYLAAVTAMKQQFQRLGAGA